MKNIKINTIPFGKQALIIQCIMIIILIAIQIWMKEIEVFLLFAIVTLFGTIFLSVYQKYYNIICVNDDGVRYRNNFIPWDELRITMFYISNMSRGRVYYITFSQHYYATKDIRKILKQGFYIMLNHKRLNIILDKYNQKIEVLGDLGYRKELYNAVKKHNLNISNYKGD